MIGHALWTRRYGGDPAIVGRTIQINAAAYTVVGVLPPGFKGLGGNAEAWVPFAVYEPEFMTQRYAHGYYLIARRKPDIAEAQAIAAARVLGTQIAAEYNNKSWAATAASLYSSRVDRDLRRAALVLLGAVGLVLLIACVNLTNLLIAKALGQRRVSSSRRVSCLPAWDQFSVSSSR
jgi:putative ABC transport system permease protein